MKNRSIRSSLHRRQRGVVLIFCLIVLVVLLAGGVAVIRSTNASLFSAGNLAFKRDLVNRGEAAMSQATTALKAGGALASATLAQSSLPAENYSAAQLLTNDRGVPNVLLVKTFPGSGNDITGTPFTQAKADIDAGDGVTVRYVIDRLCGTAGLSSTLGASGCVVQPRAARGGTSTGMVNTGISSGTQVVYRVSVRVDGPRDTQVFLQGSFTRPE